MSKFNKAHAIILSSSLHALLFLLLANFDQEKPKGVEPIEIELFSRHDKAEKLEKVTNASKENEKEVKKRIVLKSESEFKKDKQELKKLVTKKQTNKTPQKQVRLSNLTGESDVELELKGGAPKNERQRYLAQIRGRVAMGQVYPRSSKRFKEEGTVKLLLTVERNGSLSKVEIINKSKFKRLDDAALSAVVKVAPFKNFPETITFNKWKIKLPVKFSLTN